MRCTFRAASAAVFFVVSVFPVHAGEPLEEVVITATRTATPVTQIAVPVIIITREQIEASLAGDVTHLLEIQPGLEIARSGGPGQAASLFTRGSNSNHTAVLIDGVRINPGTLGGAPLQDIAPESIERIEIVKGPRSALYGSDAIGGVVNIITRAGAARGASLLAAAGKYGETRFAADGGVALGEYAGLGGSISQQDTDGFAPRTGSTSSGAYRNSSGNLQLRATPTDALTLHAQGWRASGRNHYDNFGSQGIQDFIDASYNAGADWSSDALNARVAVTRAQVDIQQRLSPDYARTGRNGQELQGGWQSGVQRLSAGVLLSQETTDALSFGTQFKVDTRVQQYFAQDQLQSDGHSLLLAYGHTHHQTFGDHDTWNAEYAYDFGTVRLHAAGGTGFHAPDSTERFGFGGNPALKPETSRQFELGVAWTPTATQSLHVDAFENRIDDLIDYVITNFVTFAGSNQNVEHARVRGVEGEYRYVVRGFELQLAGTWQQPLNLTSNTPLLRRARQHYSLSASHQLGALRLGADMLYEGKRQDAGFPSSVELPGYALLSLSAGYDISSNWSVQARVDNALDRRYEEIRGYNTARRALMFATRLRFH